MNDFESTRKFNLVFKRRINETLCQQITLNDVTPLPAECHTASTQTLGISTLSFCNFKKYNFYLRFNISDARVIFECKFVLACCKLSSG